MFQRLSFKISFGDLLSSVFCVLLFAFSNAHALVKEISAVDNKKLIINGGEVQLNVVATAGPGIRITIDGASEQQFSIEEADQTIFVRTKNAKSTDKIARAKIEIYGKSIPIEAHLIEGSFSISKWTRDIFVHVQKGRIYANNNNANIIAHAQKGEIVINNHGGNVTIDNFQAVINMKDQIGDLNLMSYQGDAILEKLNGNLLLGTTLGHLKVLSGQGSVQFEVGKGTLSTNKFKGRVEGAIQDGQININLAPEEDVSIKSQTAKISITTPPASGILLNLQNMEGEIYVPAYLKVSREGTQKLIRARLKGEIQKNSVFVRSQEGTIFIK